MTAEDFEAATWHPGTGKKSVHLRLDAEVLEWYRAQGRGYQTRINHVLAAYMRAGERRSKRSTKPR